VLLFGAVVAEACLDYHGGCGGAGGDEVDGAPDGVGAVEGGAGAVQDVGAGDGFERHRDVEVQVATLGVVDAEAVDQDEGLLEGGAAQGDVGLHTVAGAGLDVHRGIEAEVILDAVEQQRRLPGVEHDDGAVVGRERHGFDGGGDVDALLDAARLGSAGKGLDRLLRHQAKGRKRERCKKEGTEDLHGCGLGDLNYDRACER